MGRPVLNRQLVLETPDRVADGAGGYVETWRALGTLWANVSGRSGRGRQIGGVSLAAVPLRIVVRAAPVGTDARPVPGQRFREGARLYPIDAVTEHGAEGLYLTCFATEEVAS